MAQREFSRAHGDAIAAEFDMGKFGYPVVNHVGDVNWLSSNRYGWIEVDGGDSG